MGGGVTQGEGAIAYSGGKDPSSPAPATAPRPRPPLTTAPLPQPERSARELSRRPWQGGGRAGKAAPPGRTPSADAAGGRAEPAAPLRKSGARGGTSPPAPGAEPGGSPRPRAGERCTHMAGGRQRLLSRAGARTQLAVFPGRSIGGRRDRPPRCPQPPPRRRPLGGGPRRGLSGAARAARAASGARRRRWRWPRGARLARGGAELRLAGEARAASSGRRPPPPPVPSRPLPLPSRPRPAPPRPSRPAGPQRTDPGRARLSAGVQAPPAPGEAPASPSRGSVRGADPQRRRGESCPTSRGLVTGHGRRAAFPACCRGSGMGGVQLRSPAAFRTCR